MHVQLKLIVCAACVLSPLAALAHHSRAAYDMEHEVAYEGTVVALDWKNPHIFITVETRDAAGKSVRQEIEVSSISEARALGLTKEAVAPGTKVVVRAHPGRSGAGSKAVGLTVKTADGTLYPLNTDAKLAIHANVPKAQSIAGHWAPTVDSFNGLMAAVPSWSLTQSGHEAQIEAGGRLQAPGVATLGVCKPFPAPLLSIFPDMRTIEVKSDQVVMRFEGGVGLLMERVVHLDQKAHPAGLKPTLMGHSIGHWEGQALVIDTVGFTPYDLGLIGLPSTAGKHLQERLSLADDQLHLNYTFTLEDPKYLQQPATYTASWDHRPDLELASANTCDAENARRAVKD